MYENNGNNLNNETNSQQNAYREYYYTAGTNNGYNQPTNPTGAGVKQKKKRPFFKKAVAFACCGVLFGLTAGAAFSVPTYLTTREMHKTQTQLEQTQQNLQNNNSNANNAGTPALSTTTGALSSSNVNFDNTATANTVADIAKNCLPSVVSITNKGVTEVRTMFGTYRQDTEGSGSGIIIGQNDTELLIVTNYHVISGSNELSVVFSYDEDSENPSLVSAKIKGYDADKDLAVISVSLDDITDDMRSQIKIATIGDSSNLALGEEVVAIGNALGYGQSVTRGIISALNREVTVSDDNGGTITNKLIQTDAAINPGNSGGALLNMKGELIGINSVKVASSSVEGMGYAIPISDVQSIIEELMLKETREVVDEKSQGYIGIGGTDVTSEISQTYGIPVGIYVNTVYEDSPAERAGLSKGSIITKFDGQTVKSMSELKSLLAYYKAGETVNVVAMTQSNSGYVEQSYSLTLGNSSVLGDDAPESEDDDSEEDGQNNYNGNGFNFPYDAFDSFWPMP